MSTCNINMFTCDLFINKSHVDINKSHVNIIMLHVDMNKSHVNIIMLHVDIIYLACRGQKYATIVLIIINQHFTVVFECAHSSYLHNYQNSVSSELPDIQNIILDLVFSLGPRIAEPLFLDLFLNSSKFEIWSHWDLKRKTLKCICQ